MCEYREFLIVTTPLVATLLATPHAQTGTGIIEGVATDQAGAALSGPPAIVSGSSREPGPLGDNWH
jgi:hypothetical protein